MDKKYKNKTFSIIVPVYIPHNIFIIDCIESIKKQTCHDFECVLVVPATQKNDFLDLGLALNENFKILYSKNSDPASNRNLGINSTSGEYIIFIDSDDKINNHYLEICKQDIINYSPSLIAMNHTRVESELLSTDVTKIQTKYYEDKESVKNIFFSSYYRTKKVTNILMGSCWAKAFKRSLINCYSIKFDEGNFCGEDSMFVLDFGIFCESILLHENFFSYFYRRNPYSVTSDFFGQFFDVNLLCAHLDQINKQMHFNDEIFEFSKNNILSEKVNRVINYIVENRLSIFKGLKLLKNTYGKESYVYNTFKIDKRFIANKYVLQRRYIMLFFAIVKQKIKRLFHF